MDALRSAQQRYYAGGQVWPSCDEGLGDADVYCCWCGEQRRERVTNGDDAP